MILHPVSSCHTSACKFSAFNPHNKTRSIRSQCSFVAVMLVYLTCDCQVAALHRSEVHSLRRHRYVEVPQAVITRATTNPDLLSSRGRVIGAALHEDEMCSCEVQCAVGGLVAEAIQESHLLHLQTHTCDNNDQR